MSRNSPNLLRARYPKFTWQTTDILGQEDPEPLNRNHAYREVLIDSTFLKRSHDSPHYPFEADLNDIRTVQCAQISTYFPWQRDF